MSTAPRVLGGRYEIGDLIGRGGMADVYLGHDSRLGRQVAIKMLRSDLARDHNFLQRFRREAQSAASLNHPNVVAIFDSGEDEVVDASGARHTLPFIVMEYVDGQTLRQRLAEVDRLDPSEAIKLTQGVLEALAYSHRMGIVHRDIKPANVMITTSGHVKVMDFGIARAIADTAATMTATQSVVGTAQYLSPEQAQGQTVDARSDLYSTGCLLFELLTGRTPFTGDSAVAIAYQHVGEAPQPPSIWNDEVGGDLDAVTLHALAKERTVRYQSASEFLDDLEAVRTGRPISAAALGSGALAGAAATQTLPQGYAAAGVPTAVQPPITSRRERFHNTAGPPAVGREVDERDRRGGGGKAALIVLLSLLALGLIGWGAATWFDNQEPDVVMVTVPDLRGKTAAEAEQLLAAQQLKGEATEEPNEAAAGTVLSQDPAPNTQAAQNSTVAYVVSSGPESVSVPPVTGMTKEDAQQAIEDAGLKVAKFVVVDSPDQDKDRVLETVPPARETVAKGTGIEVRIASGNVKIPDNLVGQDWAVVANILSDLKVVAKKEEVESAEQASGTVLEVANAGQAVPVGSDVVVKVAKAPAPVPETTTITVPPPTTPTETEPLPLPTTPPPADGGGGG